MTVSHSTLSGNSANNGGGIFNATSGTLTVSHSTLSDNSAIGDYASYGGGIYSESNTGKVLVSVSHSTLSGNSAIGEFSAGGGIYSSALDGEALLSVSYSTLSGNSANYGGGIYNSSYFGEEPTAGSVTVTHSTLSGNSAGYSGGGIYHSEQGGDGVVTVAHSTLTGNSADEGGGIYHNVYLSTPDLTFESSILAGNAATTNGPDCAGDALDSAGYNLLGNNSGCTFNAAAGDLVGTPGNPIDPLLGPLQDNGGPTFTHALLPESPAIDTGNPAECPSTDQRGFPRPVDGDGNGSAICDIGAFERGVPGDFFLRHDPDSLDICAPADAVYEIRVGSEGGYADPVSLTAMGVPPGAAHDFDPNPVTPPGISMFTISNTAAAAAGSYEMDVTGAGSSGSHTTTMTLNLYKRIPGRPLLLTPPNGAANQPLQPTFTWQAALQARTYTIEIALDRQFTQIVDSASGLVDPTYTPAIVLNPNTRYFWRVRAENACGNGRYSAVFKFRTGSGA